MNTMTTASRFRTMIAATLVGAVASGFAVLPAVADSFDAPQITVKFGDLNISSPQGVAALYARIQGAASRVCSQFDNTRDLGAVEQRAKCINKAISNAVTGVSAPALSAIYSEKTGKEVPMRLVSR
jgi:UrcA family protein